MDRLIALVVLRWRLDLRALARARERLLGILLMVPGLLFFSAFGSFVAWVGVRSVERARPEMLLPLLSAVATGVGLFWALSPLLAGVAFTESHDMSRLLHFPIPLPTLVGSSLVANLAQPMVLAEAPILAALALALSGRTATLPLTLAGVVLSFVFILVTAQVAGLVLHGVARSRRLQDLALFVGLGAGFLLSVAPVLLLAGGGRSLGAAARLLLGSDVFALSPFAWGVRAAVHAGRGEMLAFVGWSALGLGAIGAAVALASVLVGRIHRGELDLRAAPQGAAARARMVFSGSLGALVEKDLRAAWRDPALKATLLVGLVGPLLFLFVISQGSGAARSGTAVLLLASFVGLSTYGANAFGFERRGLALLLGFPMPRWRILVAKNLSAMVLRLPGLVMLLLAGLFLAGPAYLPSALAIAFSTQLIASGFDNYLSILFPIPVPAAGRSPYSGGVAGGRGLGAAALGTALMGVALAVSVPFASLAWFPFLFGWPAIALVSLPLGVAGAAAVYAMLVGGAARLLVRREPELLERVLVEE